MHIVLDSAYVNKARPFKSQGLPSCPSTNFQRGIHAFILGQVNNTKTVFRIIVRSNGRCIKPAPTATRETDLILCTTTASEPIPTKDDVSDNAVIVAVGSHSPQARELASDLVASATVIVEDMGATLREGGDIIQPLNEGVINRNDLLSYADVVSRKVNVTRNKPIVFKFTGMPWEDLALAEAIAEKVSAQA
ncbi:hypothetical protein QP888_10780 [Corynebacterium sp. MSK297]|uniref:hypothetical protein n=1 Tax=Corynebacterium sp. MSK297 TaxID=3050221 RepID=UPI00254D32CA|nr:hypothetical protein [Corynebacterium sp. MSK297]MDK8846958.1 hypothetical protein [Corynebacterium sp. MSK297]